MGRNIMKITEWWWAFVWGLCAWFGASIGSAGGWWSDISIGVFIGNVFGALAMRWNIKVVNKL